MPLYLLLFLLSVSLECRCCHLGPCGQDPHRGDDEQRVGQGLHPCVEQSHHIDPGQCASRFLCQREIKPLCKPLTQGERHQCLQLWDFWGIMYLLHGLVPSDVRGDKLNERYFEPPFHYDVSKPVASIFETEEAYGITSGVKQTSF